MVSEELTASSGRPTTHHNQRGILFGRGQPFVGDAATLQGVLGRPTVEIDGDQPLARSQLGFGPSRQQLRRLPGSDEHTVGGSGGQQQSERPRHGG